MHRNSRRIATLVLAPTAALGAWALIRLLGVDLVVSTGSGTVGAADVVFAAVVVSLLAWIVAGRLERHVQHPRRWWAFLTSTGLSVSMLGPSYLADGSSAVALICLHFVTAAVVIAGFGGTLPWREVRSTEPHGA
ncbi:MAG TPA: DUF6069 family protein [Gaiellaceae bacterium]|nr:DUF6069 family protein [Gaiellaceae bacterium]